MNFDCQLGSRPLDLLPHIVLLLNIYRLCMSLGDANLIRDIPWVSLHKVLEILMSYYMRKNS